MSKSRKALKKKLKRRRESIHLVDRIVDLKDAGPAVREMQGLHVRELTERYKRIREAGRRLNNLLCEMLDIQGLRFSAQLLGILQGDTFVLNDEKEMIVVYDHAIHNYRPSGVNAIGRLANESPPAEGSDEAIWLAGAQRSYHSMFLIVDRLPGFAVQARDVLTGDAVLIADTHFSRSNAIGLTVSARLLPMADFCITSGTVLPIAEEQVLPTIGDYLRRVCGTVKNFRSLPRERALLLESFIIRTCLKAGAMERIRHEDGPL